MTAVRVPTPDEIRRWPATVDVPTGLSPWGLGRDAAYRLAKEGGAPVPILILGRRLRVARSAVMSALGIAEVTTSAPSAALASAGLALVKDAASDQRSDAASSSEAA